MVKRKQKRTSPGKIRRLVERKETLEANFAELSVLIPDMQIALDSDDVPWSVKKEKIDYLSSLLLQDSGFFPTSYFRTMQQICVDQPFSSEV